MKNKEISLNKCKKHFINYRKHYNISEHDEHKKLMDMLIVACMLDETLRTCIITKDYNATLLKAGRAYRNETTDKTNGVFTCTTEQLFPYMIAAYKDTEIATKKSLLDELKFFFDSIKHKHIKKKRYV